MMVLQIPTIGHAKKDNKIGGILKCEKLFVVQHGR